MTYFLSDSLLEHQQLFSVEKEEFRHLTQSRRIKAGERVEFQDKELNRFECEIVDITKKKASMLPMKRLVPPPESKLKINLYVGLVKEKAIDFIIQKFTEIGGNQLTFFESEYSQKLKQRELPQKLERWTKIATEACKQSGRAKAPNIQYDRNASNLTSPNSNQNTFVLDNRNEGSFLSELNGESISLIIGPEGGLSDTDLGNLPYKSICFGPRVMKTETAAIFITSVLQYRFGDMG